jgi:hypothetical protein
MIAELVALLSALNPFPVVQMAVGAVILVAGIWLMLRAERDRRGVNGHPGATVSAPLPDGVGMFFNGPLVVALECCREMASTLRRIEEQVREIRASAERQERALDAIERAGERAR